MKKNDFSVIVFKVNDINSKLENELKTIKIPKDIDKAIENKIKELIDYIADDEILGEDRFNFVIDHLKIPCKLPHALATTVRLDAGIVGSDAILNKLLGNNNNTNIFSSLTEAKTMLDTLIKNCSKEQKNSL